MAEQLASGNSVTLQLDANDYVSITGSASVMVVGATASASATNSGTVTYGPYSGGASMRIVASGAVSYTVTQPSFSPVVQVDSTTGTLDTASAAALVASSWKPQFTQLPYLQKANWCFIDTGNAAFGFNYTQHVQMTVEAPFVAVQIGVVNGYTTGGVQTVKVAVSTMSAAGASNSTAPLNAGGTWVSAGVGGASLTVPAATIAAVAPGIAWGDVIPLASLARSDGGTLPLLCVRVQQPSGNNLTGVVGATNAGTPFELEAGTAAKGRLYRTRGQSVLGVDNTTLTAMNTTVADQSYGPPIIVRYFLASGTGRTITVFGDSIDCGYGQSAVGTNSWTWIREAASLKSTPSKPIEVCCLAGSGMPMIDIYRRAAVLAQHCKGTTAIIPLGTPNSVPTGVISQATMDTQSAQFAQLYKALTDQGINTIVRTFLPANPGAKAWGAGDSLRRAANDARVANASSGDIVLDVASKAAGEIDVSGQQLLALSESDNLHPTSQLAYEAAPLLSALL